MGWLAVIRRKDIKKGNYPFIMICSDQFKTRKPATLHDSTNPDWISTLNLGHHEKKEEIAQDIAGLLRGLQNEEK